MRSPTSGFLGCVLVLGACALGASRAEAQGESEPWFFTLDVGATGPLNDPPVHLFNVGGDTSFGVYRSLFPELAVGSRIRMGVLSEGEDLAQIAGDPGVLDYGIIAASARYRPLARLMRHHHGMNADRRATSLYIDVAPGVALLDGDAVFAYEAAVGYNFDLGPIALGPAFRFTHFIDGAERFGDLNVMTWTGGLQMAFNDYAETPAVRATAPTRQRHAEGSDRDGDWYLDDRDDCPDQAEVWNGLDDADGCPDEGTGRFENDALVVDERVFFDFDSPDLRPTGAAQLDEVVAHYERVADRLESLTIAGHADSRGAVPYNAALSRKRGEHVVIYLKNHGVPGTALRLQAFGEGRPAIANADSEYDHQVNRRVEFGLEWREGMRPEGEEPVAHLAMPEYVDEAPRAVQEREARIARRQRRGQEPVVASAEPAEPPSTDERQASLVR